MAFIIAFDILEHYPRLQSLAWSFLAYLIGLVVYRLYLSPIAKIQGSKFTAVTRWCQFYHDVIREDNFHL